MTVRYMPHMPELQHVSGKARYEGGTLHFDVASGTTVGLRTAGATIDLTGLDGPAPQYANLRVPITGSAPDVIRFLARPKLGLSRDVLYDYQAGRRRGRDRPVAERSRCSNALTVAEIDIKAEAQVSKFSLKNALGERRPHRRRGAGQVRQLRAQRHGQRQVRRQPGRHRLARAVRRQGAVSPALRPQGHDAGQPRGQGGISLGRALRDRARSRTTLHYQVATNGTSEVVGRFELKGAKAQLPPLGWTKEPAPTASSLLTLKLAAGGKLTTIDFEGRANGLSGKGQVRFAGDNVVQQVTLQQIKIGRTDIVVDWKRVPGGVELSLRGPSLELPRVRAMMKSRDELAAKEPGGAAATARSNTKIDPADRAGPDRARHAGLRQRPPRTRRAIASPRPT